MLSARFLCIRLMQIVKLCKPVPSSVINITCLLLAHNSLQMSYSVSCFLAVNPVNVKQGNVRIP